MSEQHTVYYTDEEDDLADWIEKYEDVLGGRSDLYKRAIVLLRRDHEGELKSLSEDDDLSDMIT